MCKNQKICCYAVMAFFLLVISNASGSQVQEIPLQRGWNLFSFSINTVYYDSDFPPTVPMLSNAIYEKVTSLNDVMISIHGKYEEIRNYDSNGTSYYNPNYPSFLNSLQYLAPGYGYWIRMRQPAALSFTGVYASPSDELVLLEGWNLVGCWHQEVQYASSTPPTVSLPAGISSSPVSSVSDIFSSIDGKYTAIIKLDPNGAGIFDPQLPEYLNTLDYISPGYGYWIKMKESASLHY